jgi:diguanylate cyclase (GGDEF)-like protein/PAS domain S-box-containing protein
LILSVDLEGVIQSANRYALETLGYDRQDLLRGKVWAELCQIQLPHEGHESCSCLWQVSGQNGQLVTLEITVSPLQNPLGEPTGQIVIGKNVAIEHELKQALVRSEAKFRAFMDHAPILSYIKDEAGRIVFANRLLLQSLGRQLDEVVGKSFHDLWPKEKADLMLRHDQRVITTGIQTVDEETTTTADGRTQTWLSFRFPMSNSADQKFVAGISLDITDRKYYESQMEDYQRRLESAVDELERIAHHDSLTGLKNRGSFGIHLEEEVNRASRYGLELSLLMIDVDHFKTFNDTYGHVAGDELLQQVGTLLSKTARSRDFVARYGGEEFVIILPNTPGAGGYIAAEKFRQAIQSHAWEHRSITVSIGVSSLNSSNRDVMTLIKAADEALYQAKEGGRNQVVQYRPPVGGSSHCANHL